jgi:hypothetical protein
MNEELIIKYLEGNLSVEEKITIENIISNDPSIIEEIQMIKSLDSKLINLFQYKTNKNLNNSIYQAYLNQQPYPPLLDLNKKESWYINLLEFSVPFFLSIFLISLISYLGIDFSLDASILKSKGYVYCFTVFGGAILLFLLDKILYKRYQHINLFL